MQTLSEIVETKIYLNYESWHHIVLQTLSILSDVTLNKFGFSNDKIWRVRYWRLTFKIFVHLTEGVMMKYSVMKCAILIACIVLCNANDSLVEETYVNTGKYNYTFL